MILYVFYFYNQIMKHLKEFSFQSLKFPEHCDMFFKIIVHLYIYTFFYMFICLFYRGPYGRLVLHTKYVILLK